VGRINALFHYDLVEPHPKKPNRISKRARAHCPLFRHQFSIFLEHYSKSCLWIFMIFLILWIYLGT